MKTLCLMLAAVIAAPSASAMQIDALDLVIATQDPGDSLYRAARRELNRGNYQASVELFLLLRERYPRSSFVPQTYYWEAFALQRLNDLDGALARLRTMEAQYPNAASRSEAAALATRICGELARKGDRECAARVALAARRIEERTRAEAATMREMTREQARLNREEAAVARESAAQSQSGVNQGAQDGDDLQVAALNALLNMDAQRALPILRRLLENRDSNPELRRRAIFLLSQHQDDETRDLLLNVVRDDPDPEVREQAVFWLSQVEGEAVIEALESVLQNPEDAALHERAIFALSQHDSDRAQVLLRAYAANADGSEQLRDQAIFSLGQRPDAGNIDFLKRLYARLASARLRERVIFSVAQSGQETDWLLDRALEPEAPVELRKQAIFWAGQSGASIARLVELYDGVDEPEMKHQLLFVLSQRTDEQEAVDKLLDIARNEADREARRLAIFWLGQSDDPRVVDLLLEIIDQ